MKTTTVANPAKANPQGATPCSLIVSAIALCAATLAQAAATTQSFLFVGLDNGVSDWSDPGCWKLNAGGSTDTWVTPTGAPDASETGYSYDIYFRSGMTGVNNTETCSFTPGWNRKVFFTGERTTADSTTQRDIHIDAGSTAENPIVFAAAADNYGLTVQKKTLLLGETDDGYLKIDSGTYKFGNVYIGNDSDITGVMTITGATVDVTTGYPRIGAARGSTGTLTVKKGGTFSTLTATSYQSITVGYAANSTGTLNVEGGTVLVKTGMMLNYNTNTKESHVSVTDGGVLAVGTVYLRYKGTNGGTITIDDGTLRAYAYTEPFIQKKVNGLDFYVGPGGATFDSDGNEITIEVALEDKPGTVGKVAFTGGGKITLTASPSYTGVTTVEAGTTLVVPTLEGCFTGGFKTSEAPAALDEGIYPYIVISGEGTIPDSLLSGLVAPEGCRFVRSGDGKTVFCVSGNPTAVWTGGASGSLSDPGNWSTGIVPQGGECVIGNATAANLVKGDGFAAETIVFAEDSAPVSISGDFTTLTSIVNQSANNMTFTGGVDFGNGNVDVTLSATYNDKNETITGGCVVFAGGVRGADVAKHRIFTGNYTLTKTAKFNFTATGANRYVLNTNATLSVKSTDRTEEFYIKPGATFHTENASNGWAGESTTYRLWCWNEGTFLVDNYVFNGRGQQYLGGYVGSSASRDLNTDSVFKIGKATVNSAGQLWLHNAGSSTSHGGDALTIYVGAGGLNIAAGKTGYFGVKESCHASTIRPWNSDFTIGRGNNADYDFMLNEAGTEFAIHTTDEGGTARTVTLDGRITTEEHDDTTITVKGTGVNVVNSASPLMTGTYAVADTATVVLGSGSGFANGTVAVGGTATLAVSGAGAASVKNLTFAEGAMLAFNFTDRQAAPVLAIAEGGTVAFAGEGDATVKVKISGDVRPVSGKKALTTGGGFGDVPVSLAEGVPEWVSRRGISVNEDGDIVLDVKPRGMVVVFR